MRFIDTFCIVFWMMVVSFIALMMIDEYNPLIQETMKFIMLGGRS